MINTQQSERVGIFCTVAILPYQLAGLADAIVSKILILGWYG